jgi:hypothetical protein
MLNDSSKSLVAPDSRTRGDRHSSLYSQIPFTEWQSRRQLFKVVYMTVIADTCAFALNQVLSMLPT